MFCMPISACMRLQQLCDHVLSNGCALAASKGKEHLLPQPNPPHPSESPPSRQKRQLRNVVSSASPAAKPQQAGPEGKIVAMHGNVHKPAASPAGAPVRSPSSASQEQGMTALSTRSLQSQRSLKGLKSLQARRRQEAALDAIVAKYI